MALPWSAPGYGQGIFPGEASFPGPASVAAIAEAIARQNIYRQNQQQQQLQSAFAAIGDAMKQRQQDAIASQLLAGEAPRAEYAGPSSTPQPTQVATASAPVDPAYAERGLTDQSGQPLSPTGQPVAAPVTPVQRTLAAMTPVTTPPVGIPSTSLSRDEAARNAALGYPTKQILPPTVLYAEKERQTKEDLDRLYRAAQIQHLTNLTAGAAGRGSATADRYVTVADDSGNQIKVTGNEAAQLLAGGKGFSGASETKRGWELPDGTFTNDPTKASQFIPGVTAQSNAATDGTHVQVQFPKQKSATTLPASTWDAVKGGQGWHIVGGGAGGGVGRPSGNTAAQVGEKRVFPDGVRTWDGTKWTL